MLSFFVGKGKLEHDLAAKMEDKAQNVFIGKAKKENERLAQEDPVKKFLETLEALITSSRVRLESTDQTGNFLGGNNADIIGCYDEDYFYLFPTATWHVITIYYRAEGNHFPVSHQTLYRLLEKRKVVLPSEERITMRKRIGKESPWVLKLDRNVIKNL